MTVIEELHETFKAQQQTIDTLTMKLDQANARIAELEEQLHKDSHNSSKPPSSDGFDKPSPKSQRKKSGKKAGGQTGHKGHHMKLSKPDRIEADYPQHCADCPHTKGEIAIADDRRSAVVTVDSEILWVGIISDGGEISVMNAELLPTSLAVPNQTDNSIYRKLAVHLSNTRDATISVACVSLKQGETKPAWLPSVKAIFEWTPQTIAGDVNSDGKFSIANLVSLQKWLLTVPDSELKNWKSADFCEDNKLDVCDFTLMKRSLIQDSITAFYDIAE